MGNIKLFENRKVRTHWDEEKEAWYFSIIDVIQILTDSLNPRRYWSDLKRKLESEGFIQLYDIVVQLKLESTDGKKYLTDCADAQGLLRIIQSIPSPKAEPFKQWLAKTGYERTEEIKKQEFSPRSCSLAKIWRENPREIGVLSKKVAASGPLPSPF